MYLKIKSIATDIFLVAFFVMAMITGGCSSYHSGIGFSRDLSTWGDDMARHFHNKQQKLDHGRHYEHYNAYSNPIYDRIRSVFDGE